LPFRFGRARLDRDRDGLLVFFVGVCRDAGSSLSELRKAVSITEEGSRRARRVYGDEHPDTMVLFADLQEARATLARRTPSPP
jgi:hypothetical protein